jgi:hypothetical protein
MADRTKGGITGPSGKNVDPLYNRGGMPAIPSQGGNFSDLMNGPKWGAGDPDYIKKMIASGKAKAKSKPQPKK